MKKAFTLVEVLIVVSILGILAAITVPQFQNHIQQAKESAAKDNLRILRNAIEHYTLEHNDTPPGYVNGSFGGNSTIMIQLLLCSDLNGNSNGSITKSGNYLYGPYIKNIPENPFTGEVTITSYPDNMDMPTEATGDFAWIYKPSTKDLKINTAGSDADGKAYFDY